MTSTNNKETIRWAGTTNGLEPMPLMSVATTAFSAAPLMMPVRFYASQLLPLYNSRARRRPRAPRCHEPRTAVTSSPPATSSHLSIPCEMLPQQNASSPPFSAFFATYFAEKHPSIASLIPDHKLSLAAAVYLFRYDHCLTRDFVSSTIDKISSLIADVSGKSLPESRRLFTSSARAATQVYFANNWDDIPAYTAANIPILLDLQKRNRKLVSVTEALQNSTKAVDVDPPELYALLDNNKPVLVLVYADYCSVCKATRPKFDIAAKETGDEAFFVAVNGPRSPQFKLYYQVSSYPTILRFDGHDIVSAFPDEVKVTTESIVEFAEGLLSDVKTSSPVLRVGEAPGSPGAVVQEDSKQSEEPGRTPAYEWASMLIKQGIDELEELESERSEVFQPRIDVACGPSKCPVMPTIVRSAENGDPPPLCILLGGGMGAGKTTAVGLMRGTEFWKQYGEEVVTVEADAFKLNDPLFHVLPNRIVHHDAIIAAEELFLQAVNNRRDVVFDGTLSWCEYARQTVEMLRDTEFTYKRGAGYKDPAGNVIEEYWVRDQKRPESAKPYQVELVGVTAAAEIAVMRGIVRQIISGRGVPVQDQLHSHRLFSKNFEEYVELVDAVYLFDTTLSSSLTETPGYEDQLVGIKPGVLFENPPFMNGTESLQDGFAVRTPQDYAGFLRKSTLNTNATCVAELYHSTFQN